MQIERLNVNSGDGILLVPQAQTPVLATSAAMSVLHYVSVGYSAGKNFSLLRPRHVLHG